MFCDTSQTTKYLNYDLVYQFKCNGCDTLERVSVISSHMSSGSNIAEHNNKCKGSVGIRNFKII